MIVAQLRALRALRELAASAIARSSAGRPLTLSARPLPPPGAPRPARSPRLSPAREQVFFPLFANLKTAFDGNNSMLGLFCAGALAGSSAAGVVTPCDVVKTRLQVAGSTYTGVGDAFTRILREEGAAALFKGVQVRAQRGGKRRRTQPRERLIAAVLTIHPTQLPPPPRAPPIPQPRMMVQAPLFGITLGAFDVQKRWYAQRMEAASKVA